ncbi:MAG: cytochrome c biogenesis protein CcsA [Bdellovibrionota bacterium]
MKTLKLSLVSLLMVFTSLAAFADSGTDALKRLPVQDAGRIKPLDTLARETLQLIYGSQTYKTKKGEKRSAVEVVMTWMLVPQYWDEEKLIEITHRGLKESLSLPNEEKFYSPKELFANQRLSLVMQQLAGRRETKEKLDPYYQAVQRLESQLGSYQGIKEGTLIRVAPPAPGEATQVAGMFGDTEKWQAVSELRGDLQEKFALVTRSFIHALPSENSAPAENPPPPLDEVVEQFIVAARAQNPALYPDGKDIAVEIHYKALHPFLISWILYLLSAIVVGIAWQSGRQGFYKAGWILAILAFLMHTYGFGLRVYLTGRPPVSNMYESVIWVSWGAILFALIFEWLGKRRFVLISGAVVAVLCLIVADLAPAILDPSLQPLEPVLRSNMWLMVHVLTITLSYSAFFLAWSLGNVGLAFVLRGEKPTSDRPRALTDAVYRSMQVGIVLLAAGTILGGVWADYSWGRFWGWDPKETWAFIALLGYLAVLHGRLVGWVRNFGLMVCAVVAFNLVIMAWYGVNFVLGAGLHAYGFGAGGAEYMAAFVILNLIYVAYVAYVNRSREALELREKKQS